MIRAETLHLQIRPVQMRRYRGILWAALAGAAYILAYSLATNNVGTDFGNWPLSWEPPIQEPIDTSFEWLGDNLAWFFNPISEVIDTGLAGLDTFLLWLPWIVVVAVAAMLGFRLGGRWLGLFCAAATLFIGFNGYWDSAMLTMSVLVVSVIIAVGIGVPIGIFVAFNNRLEAVVRPILDTMQVLPAFVYLIPALILFGVSGAQGVFLTVVYCIPPVIRLTNLGIRQVPKAATETAYSHGSTASQTLFQVQLPLAKSSIMMGINQTIMMAVAMVIITALVGVDGLGRDVWLSLREVDAGEGLESGIAIVLLAIILDRLSYALANSGPHSTTSGQAISPGIEAPAGRSLTKMAAHLRSSHFGRGSDRRPAGPRIPDRAPERLPKRPDLFNGGSRQQCLRLDGRQPLFHYKLGTGQPVPGTWLLTHLHPAPLAPLAGVDGHRGRAGLRNRRMAGGAFRGGRSCLRRNRRSLGHHHGDPEPSADRGTIYGGRGY